MTCRAAHRALPLLLGTIALGFVAPAVASAAPAAPQCQSNAGDDRRLLWGDLHVHTAWSLDAYAFGAVASPADAFAFARGQELRLANGELTRIDRPLDFAAVTDHAETFDVMHLCTDPQYGDNAYCRDIRDATAQKDGRRLFTDYLLPIVAAGEVPQVCDQPGQDCAASSRGQWRRVQAAANRADEPCAFTAFIGYEWSASPGGRHWHRNVLFRSDKVPNDAFDYVRYPKVEELWAALDRTCKPADGCDVLAIPHNINWADGGGFDIASESPEQLAQRARYERLAEIHQEKGSSECLPEDRDDPGDDCAFERLTSNFAQQHESGPEQGSPEVAWQRMRSTYYRSLLTRGLLASQTLDPAVNPLMLGAVGSTDNHLGTPGRVQEAGYWGAMSMLWQTDEARLANAAYNPGGLVGVWAQENTRASVFDALKRREAYATSGPRIRLRFGLVPEGTAPEAACEAGHIELAVPMGGVWQASSDAPGQPRLLVMADKDVNPLARFDIVKVDIRDGQAQETVHAIAEFPEGTPNACRVWEDPDFDPAGPAYWYARVVEQPSPRWSKQLCEKLGNCAEHPEADLMIQERAWSSPVWYEPGR